MLFSVLIYSVFFAIFKGFSLDMPVWSNSTLHIPIIRPTLIPRPTLKPLPVVTPTPKPTVVPKPIPTIAPKRISASLFLDQINNYRRSQGLPSVRSNSNTCNFAKIRAQEIVSNFNHDGFTNRRSNKTLPYPSYTKVTENITRNSNPQDVVNQWISSPRHAANMGADTPYVCVANSGDFYVYEGWRP